MADDDKKAAAIPRPTPAERKALKDFGGLIGVAAVVLVGWLGNAALSERTVATDQQDMSSDGKQPSFSFSFGEFRKRFNAQIMKSSNGAGGDLIKSCSDDDDTIRCSFDDRAFQKSVRFFKNLDLANGHFAMKTRLVATVGPQGVTKIALTGDRSDPMNAFHFMGKVGDLLQTLEPGLSNDDVARELLKLNLHRGDDSPSIGEETSDIRKSVAVTCKQFHSSKSTAIFCRFEPRS